MNFNDNFFQNILYLFKIKIGLSSPELTPLDSSGYTLEELGKECKIGCH